ncbi:MAG: tyrosine-type recombinase/integrase [Akkermansiaceae bacterium]
MSVSGKFEITKPKGSRKWLLNVSAKNSTTGKRQRLKFNTKAAAEDHRSNLLATIASPRLKHYDEKLLEAANYYDETFQLLGFSGLAEACSAFAKQLDKTSTKMSLLQLVKSYKAARGGDWSKGYVQTFEWAKKQLKDLYDKQVSELDAIFWQEWLPLWRKNGGYAPKSFNHLRTFLISIYSLPSAVALFPSNPVKVIPAAKIKKKEIVVASAAEVSAILERAQKTDSEMVPWFAIAFFAGLRPESELSNLKWSDINFKEKWIRVSFGNKTDTKRFVDLSDNLANWLKPYKGQNGKILQTNHRKRKDALVQGKEETDECILTWVRDITRHTYGSNLEAQARAEDRDAKAVVVANMGHTSAQTFEQHYRNARTAKQAAEFWAIMPS